VAAPPPALEWLEDDLAEGVAADEDLKAKALTAMRGYWQEATGE